MDKDNNVPAFPIRGGIDEHQFSGMSLRDYFAAAAMQGLLTRRFLAETMHPHEYTARAAYLYADAMLAAQEGAEGGH